MGGKAMGGRRVPLAEAEKLAQTILHSMVEAGAITRGSVAGLVRRGKAEVGDIDLVVVPGPEFDAWMRANFGEAKNGKPKKSTVREGCQIDVLPASDQSWGAALMHFTGSKVTNIRQRAVAKSKGWMLNEKGLFDADGDLIAGASEEDVYAALGLKFLEPAERE